jgi:hypothetical protein
MLSRGDGALLAHGSGEEASTLHIWFIIEKFESAEQDSYPSRKQAPTRLYSKTEKPFFSRIYCIEYFRIGGGPPGDERTHKQSKSRLTKILKSRLDRWDHSTKIHPN